VVLGLGVTVGLVAAVSWPAVTAVETGRTPQYPELREVLLRYSAPLVLARAVETIRELEGWRLVAVDPDAEAPLLGSHAGAGLEPRPGSGLVRAEVETDVLGFVDDVTVSVTALAAEPVTAAELSRLPTVVRVRSASRVGRTDFGQNARNIERFLGALLTNLELARQVP
jgi:hypothetical protein